MSGSIYEKGESRGALSAAEGKATVKDISRTSARKVPSSGQLETEELFERMKWSPFMVQAGRKGK